MDAARGEQRWEGMPPGRATANSPELLQRLARAGAGIAMLSTITSSSAVRPSAASSSRVLADWTLPPVTAWAVFPGRRLMPARTRVFLDALAAKFSGPECQAIEAKARTATRMRQN